MSEKYKNFIRSLPCLIFEDFGFECVGGIDTHHVKTRGSGGEEKGNLIPLCRFHHSEIHKIGRLTFQQKYNTNFKLMAFELYSFYQQKGGK